MPHFKIDYDSYTDQTREPYENDGWDRGDTETTNIIHSFKIIDDDYNDGIIKFDPKYDRPYFLLYVVYGTGDSFGSDSGKIWFVDLYENMETAQANQKIIQDHGEDFSITLLSEYEEGKLTKYETSAPWIGYFEWLQDVCIENVWRK